MKRKEARYKNESPIKKLVCSADCSAPSDQRMESFIAQKELGNPFSLPKQIVHSLKQKNDRS